MLALPLIHMHVKQISALRSSNKLELTRILGEFKGKLERLRQGISHRAGDPGVMG